jgi:hypothetical protein
LLEEIPGILNICADREPSAICPVDSYAASLSQYFSRPPSRSRHRTAPVFPLASGREGNKIRLSLP